MRKTLYANRPLAAGYPDMQRRGAAFQATTQDYHPYTGAVLDCLDRLVAMPASGRRALVVGCGPRPTAIEDLLKRGYETSAVEPVDESVQMAQAFVQGRADVRLGSAERLPFEDEAFHFVLMESVLEHVDSPDKSLSEVHRVVKPGGAAYLYTTNRWKVSLRGLNGEYRVPFFNWFPDVVKESYVFHHLHYDPTLANYNQRPAFHWFSYSQLCQLGRRAGFAQFYSPLDLIDETSPFVANRRLRRLVLNWVRYRPWLRGLALTQAGGAIFMVKRPS